MCNVYIVDHNVKVDEFVKDFTGNIKKVETFEEILDQCDWEVQVRYDYIDFMLCDVEEEIFDVITSIEQQKVELELYNRLGYGNEARNIEKILENSFNVLKELEDKHSVLQVMFDEELFRVLEN